MRGYHFLMPTFSSRQLAQKRTWIYLALNLCPLSYCSNWRSRPAKSPDQSGEESKMWNGREEQWFKPESRQLLRLQNSLRGNPDECFQDQVDRRMKAMAHWLMTNPVGEPRSRVLVGHFARADAVGASVLISFAQPAQLGIEHASAFAGSPQLKTAEN